MVQAGARIGLAVRWGASLSCLARFFRICLPGSDCKLVGGDFPPVLSGFQRPLSPDLVCFVHFDFEMCFAPQRCALFRHLNFKKCSEHEVPLAFSLANVLRATTECNFSSLIWPAGSAPAALASLLFDPPERQIMGKMQCLETFLPFRAPGSSFFSDFLFCDLISSSLLVSSRLVSSLLFPSRLVSSLLFSSLLVSSLLFSSLTLSISAFHLSILSEV